MDESTGKLLESLKVVTIRFNIIRFFRKLVPKKVGKIQLAAGVVVLVLTLTGFVTSRSYILDTVNESVSHVSDAWTDVMIAKMNTSPDVYQENIGFVKSTVSILSSGASLAWLNLQFATSILIVLSVILILQGLANISRTR